MIEKGSHKWEDARRKRLVRIAPAWAGSKARNAAERLVKQLLEGNAWQADHVIPVYKGGGLCDIDNLRTLCTLCHQVARPSVCVPDAVRIIVFPAKLGLLGCQRGAQEHMRIIGSE